MMETRLCRVVVEGDYEWLVELTRNGVEILKGVTPQGNTALHIAASRGHREMVELLIQLKPCLLLMKNNKDETALHKAAAGGHVEVVKSLLDINPLLQCNCGAHERDDSTRLCDVELFWRSVNRKNETALHYAARFGHVAVVAALSEKVKGLEAIVNKRGESALFTACDHGRAAVARLLNDLPSVADTRTDGRTCLHVAIHTKQAALASDFLNKRRGLAFKADDKGNMPLHLAIFKGSLDVVVQEILRIAPETCFDVNQDKMAPIHVAAQVGRIESIRLLMESAPQYVELLGKHNKNALYLLQNAPDAAFLVNEPDDEGNTPFDIALKFHNHKAIMMMLPISTWHAKAVNGEEISALAGKMEAGAVSENGNNKDVETLSIVATLIATVTFAAAFTIPGGVSSEQGIPVRMDSIALKAFIISNTQAMCFSMSALFLLFDLSSTSLIFNVHVTYALVPLNAGSTFYYASGLIFHAFVATMILYSTGFYVLVAPRCLWLALITCSAGCVIPFISYSRALYVLGSRRCLLLPVTTCKVGCVVPFIKSIWRMVITVRLMQRLLHLHVDAQDCLTFRRSLSRRHFMLSYVLGRDPFQDLTIVRRLLGRDPEVGRITN